MKPSPLLSGALALIAPFAFLTVSGARAGIETYLHIATIPGEADAPAHNGWIDVESFSLSAVGRPAPANGLIATDFVIAKRLDKASPRLFLACAQDTLFPSVTIDLTDDFGPSSGVIFYQLILTDARVASVNLVAETVGTDRPVEEVRFSYRKIEIRYFVVNPNTGVATPEPPVTWDYFTQTP